MHECTKFSTAPDLIPVWRTTLLRIMIHSCYLSFPRSILWSSKIYVLWMSRAGSLFIIIHSWVIRSWIKWDKHKSTKNHSYQGLVVKKNFISFVTKQCSSEEFEGIWKAFKGLKTYFGTKASKAFLRSSFLWQSVKLQKHFIRNLRD